MAGSDTLGNLVHLTLLPNRSETLEIDMREKDGFDPDAIAKAMAQSAEMDESNDYVARGRSHRSLELDQLRANWVSAFKKWAHSLGVADSLELGELWAEFRLRNVEPPFDLVRDEQRMLVEEVQKHGPHNEGVRQAIASFLDELDKPKH
jgi:hypothetical protein